MLRWSLRTRFLLFAVATLIPFAAVLIYFIDRDFDQRVAQSYASDSTLASSVTRSTTSFLSANAEALEGIAQLPSVVALDPENAEIQIGAARRLRPEFSGIFLLDADQNLVTFSGTDPADLAAYISNRVDQAVSQNTVTFSQPIPLGGDATGIVMIVPVVTIQTTETAVTESAPEGETETDEPAAPEPTPAAAGDQTTQPPGQTLGVIGGIIQTDRIAQSILPSTRGNAEIALVSADNIIVATGGIDPAASQLIQENMDAILLALEGELTQFDVVDANGNERTAAAAPVTFESAPWAAVVTRPMPELFDGGATIEVVIVVSLSLVVVFALAVVLSELTARPIRTMARRAYELNQGMLREPIVPVGGGEIRALSEEFAEMADHTANQVAWLEEHRHDRERQAAQMRDLLRRTNRLQEGERRRIAGEIHDAVSPLITGALYQARALLMSNGSTSEEEIDSSLKSVSELLERATNELHDVIFELRPPDLDDLGLVAAIEAYVQTIQRTGLSCRLEASGDPPNFTPEVRLSFYRIAQEALHNVVRHAGADEAVVRLETTDELVRMTVRDNGAGFDPAQAVQPASLGLLSMRERAESIGATFTILTRPGGGTAIVVERPNSGDVMSDEVLESMMLMSSGDQPEEPTDKAGSEVAAMEPETTEPVR
ncbi:MAG TPA: ATP-binding protein [Thermomicrobiales bacterium]|nr:ATP-binding protein [Thermomicrobiales bacterium]